MLQLRLVTKFYSESAFRAFISVIALAIGLTTQSAALEPQKDLTTIFETLTHTEGATVTISTDLTNLNSNRKSDDYQPAVLTDATKRKWKVEIKTRGKFRRKNGFFPPIKIKFSKKELLAAGYKEHNGIRVTLPFYEGQQGNDLVVREYLAYRMFEHLSPVSIRARLVRLTLVDSHVESWRHEVYAIFLEDDDELCKRYSAYEEEIFGLHPDSLQSNQAALVSAFNYAIGNADWEVAGMRNVKLLRPNGGGKIVLIPYDFDFSGVVNAPYSRPSHMSGLKTIKQRFLIADGIKTDQLRRAFQVIYKEKKALYRIIQNPHLRASSQREIEEYLDGFFLNLSIDEVIGGVVRTPAID